MRAEDIGALPVAAAADFRPILEDQVTPPAALAAKASRLGRCRDSEHDVRAGWRRLQQGSARKKSRINLQRRGSAKESFCARCVWTSLEKEVDCRCLKFLLFGRSDRIHELQSVPSWLDSSILCPSSVTGHCRGSLASIFWLPRRKVIVTIVSFGPSRCADI